MKLPTEVHQEKPLLSITFYFPTARDDQHLHSHFFSYPVFPYQIFIIIRSTELNEVFILLSEQILDCCMICVDDHFGAH